MRGSAITGFQAAPRPMAMATCYHSLLSLSLAPSWLLLSPAPVAFLFLSFTLFPRLSRVLPPHDNAGQTYRFSLSRLRQKADFDRNTPPPSGKGCESTIVSRTLPDYVPVCLYRPASTKRSAVCEFYGSFYAMFFLFFLSFSFDTVTELCALGFSSIVKRRLLGVL